MEQLPLSADQEKFLNAFAGADLGPTTWPDPSQFALWLKQPVFRGKYSALRDAMEAEVLLHALAQMLIRARAISNADPDDKQREHLLRDFDRVLRARRKRKRPNRADPAKEQPLTFEDAVRGFLPDGADPQAAIDFFRHRADENAKERPQGHECA